MRTTDRAPENIQAAQQADTIEATLAAMKPIEEIAGHKDDDDCTCAVCAWFETTCIDCFEAFPCSCEATT
jgi:hypothetical protein